MKRKFTKIIPILISLIIAGSILTFAWIWQTSKIDGIQITADGEGVPLELKPVGSGYDWSQDLTIDLSNITLKPCIYDAEATHQFSDEEYNYVTNNPDYVRKVQVMIKPEQLCRVYITKEVVGDIPINVVCNDIEVTSETDLGLMALPYQTVTLQFYVDGNEVVNAGTSEVTLTLRGE